MTIDERKLAIAYADLLCIQELMQHILRMDSHKFFSVDAQMAFATASISLDKVMSNANQLMSKHTEF